MHYPRLFGTPHLKNCTSILSKVLSLRHTSGSLVRVEIEQPVAQGSIFCYSDFWRPWRLSRPCGGRQLRDSVFLSSLSTSDCLGIEAFGKAFMYQAAKGWASVWVTAGLIC